MTSALYTLTLNIVAEHIGEKYKLKTVNPNTDNTYKKRLIDHE